MIPPTWIILIGGKIMVGWLLRWVRQSINEGKISRFSTTIKDVCNISLRTFNIVSSFKFSKSGESISGMVSGTSSTYLCKRLGHN